jgi:hypothetical protein
LVGRHLESVIGGGVDVCGELGHAARELARALDLERDGAIGHHGASPAAQALASQWQ